MLNLRRGAIFLKVVINLYALDITEALYIYIYIYTVVYILTPEKNFRRVFRCKLRFPGYPNTPIIQPVEFCEMEEGTFQGREGNHKFWRLIHASALVGLTAIFMNLVE